MLKSLFSTLSPPPIPSEMRPENEQAGVSREAGSILSEPAVPGRGSPGRMENAGEERGGPPTRDPPAHPSEDPRALPRRPPPRPSPPQGPSPARHCSGTRGGPQAGLTRTHATHKSAAAAAFPPPQPGGAINEAAGARVSAAHNRQRGRTAGPAARLTIAPLDLHVNPDLDLAEVGRCHHLIWSSGGGPREGDRRAEKAGRGRGRCVGGSGCPRPRRPGRQREHEPGPRGAAAGWQAEARGLQAGGRTRTPGRRGEARAGAVRRRGGEWEGPSRPPKSRR